MPEHFLDRKSAAELGGLLRLDRKRRAIRDGTIHLEPILDDSPVPTICGATYDGTDYCTLLDGHGVPHNCRRSTDEAPDEETV